MEIFCTRLSVGLRQTYASMPRNERICIKLFVGMFFEPRNNRLNFGNDLDQVLRSGSRIKKSLINNINDHLGIRLNLLS